MIITIRTKKATALTLTFPLTDADGQPITGAAGLDSEIAQDGGGFADCTNEATEDGTTGFYVLTWTAAELNYVTATVNVKTTTPGIMPLQFIISTYTEPLDDANTELSEIPTTTGSLRKMLQFLFQHRRNKLEQTHTAQTMYKEDGSTPLGVATLTDDGTTYTKGEMTTSE